MTNGYQGSGAVLLVVADARRKRERPQHNLWEPSGPQRW